MTDLDSGTDYRRIPRAISHVYHHPLSPEVRTEISKLFDALTQGDPSDPVIEGRTLTIWGRELHVPKSTSTVAMFSFEDLCGQPLSAADYIEVTRQFGTVFVTDVKKMGLNDKDKARRFITFIDACYESKVRTLPVSIYFFILNYRHRPSSSFHPKSLSSRSSPTTAAPRAKSPTTCAA